MAQYTKIPRETLSGKDCICTKCNGKIAKGTACLVDPKSKTAHHKICKKNEFFQST